jgi:hypothetical protein
MYQQVDTKEQGQHNIKMRRKVIEEERTKGGQR